MNGVRGVLRFMACVYAFGASFFVGLAADNLYHHLNASLALGVAALFAIFAIFLTIVSLDINFQKSGREERG